MLIMVKNFKVQNFLGLYLEVMLCLRNFVCIQEYRMKKLSKLTHETQNKLYNR